MAYVDKRKKIYDESVSLIADLGFQKKISYEEMNFLLTLLDILFFKEDKAIIPVLKKWMQTNNNSEIDEIIKATLLATDLSDPKSLESCTRSVIELLEARIE